ncbi:ORFL13W_IRL [Human betaherpesvirus 5]|nr:ORFL13C [Human betaherpesvirus 5]QHX40301.1 ORFL13C_TRL [Human betaherpesvirus 5]QHX40671.1 ORFL13W_IRL [Human betaherpesvirus 5]
MASSICLVGSVKTWMNTVVMCGTWKSAKCCIA